VPRPLRQRLPAAVSLVLACIAGPAIRSLTESPVTKLGGDLLYAVAIYALVLLIRPLTPARAAAVVATALCWLVEFAQLTPFPAEASRHSALSRLVLGSTFHPSDLASYLIGVLLAWAASVGGNDLPWSIGNGKVNVDRRTTTPAAGGNHDGR
jgi:hypothetical protein